MSKTAKTPKDPTVRDFLKRFPDDDACLDHLLEVRYGRVSDCPKCGRETVWYRIRKEPAYACKWCGWHIHPMQGTPFARTRTPLQMWFHIMFMFTTTRNGVAAKEIQRQLGVTYKTAWRMGHEIRKYMGELDGDPPLSGHVEMDETYVGGRLKGKGRGLKLDNKTIVFGMVQRGGHATTRVLDRVTHREIREHLMQHVEPGTKVTTDEAPVYRRLRQWGFDHESVNHKADEWVRGEHHTNTIENFWSHVKRSIEGTHIKVSRKHMDKYLAEFEYRFNMRDRAYEMFDRLMEAFAKPAN